MLDGCPGSLSLLSAPVDPACANLSEPFASSCSADIAATNDTSYVGCNQIAVNLCCCLRCRSIAVGVCCIQADAFISWQSLVTSYVTPGLVGTLVLSLLRFITEPSSSGDNSVLIISISVAFAFLLVVVVAFFVWRFFASRQDDAVAAKPDHVIPPPASVELVQADAPPSPVSPPDSHTKDLLEVEAANARLAAEGLTGVSVVPFDGNRPTADALVRV